MLLDRKCECLATSCGYRIYGVDVAIGPFQGVRKQQPDETARTIDLPTVWPAIGCA